MPQTRQIIREISSTFWLLREILPYGQDCQVISPEGVRQRVIVELTSAVQNYGLNGDDPRASFMDRRQN
ncbi:hypothetical protein IQE94_04595 [Synechocystis sp. PCC 7339]|uniref:WYL domain-containing protein n=1 Tax=unclassified Synechocystis TaxID=2640012 RepID=UPI001BAFD899|nr:MULTISPECIES: hypothetical protein [unclassified Synechocystis]QUS61402.1 hypothetical protein HTZ78_12520 [Synechocystis sp. PCC 7338]UAJ73584.1 hypothetical protein IQE94_04595 [Synechocystis sp. PCC 7339]